MAQKVVAHFIDNTIIKGVSVDVDPGRPLCHIQTSDRGSVEVDLSQVKALYFVKDLAGRPEYNDVQKPAPGDQRLRGSHAVALTFMDGERMGGLMNRYPPNRKFFFVVPMDPRSNNLRILINREALTSIEPEQPPPSAAPPPPATRAAGQSKRTTWVFDGRGIKEIDVQ